MELERVPVHGTTRNIVDVVFEYGGILMTHDIDDLLEMIHALELRIIELETQLGTNPRLTREQMIHDDAYYWEHG